MEQTKLSKLAQKLTGKMLEEETQRLEKNKRTLRKVNELTEKVEEFKKIKKLEID